MREGERCVDLGCLMTLVSVRIFGVMYEGEVGRFGLFSKTWSQ